MQRRRAAAVIGLLAAALLLLARYPADIIRQLIGGKGKFRPGMAHTDGPLGRRREGLAPSHCRKDRGQAETGWELLPVQRLGSLPMFSLMVLLQEFHIELPE